MGDLKNSSDPRIKKLKDVIAKGEAFIGFLDKKGANIQGPRDDISNARSSFESGDLARSYTLAQRGIKELIRLKAEAERPTEEPRKEPTAPQVEKPGIKEEEKKAQPPEEIPKERTIPKRGKGVFALIRDNDQEREKKLDSWKGSTLKWREKGYLFEQDSSLFKRNFEEVDKRLQSIGQQIEKAEVFQNRIRSMREEFDHVGGAFLKKLDDVKESILRLDRLDDVKRRIETLNSNLQEVDSQYKVLSNRMSRYRRQGLNISSLEDLLENDSDLTYLEQQFNIYETNIEFLSKEKAKLTKIRNDGFAQRLTSEIDDIERIIDDPWKLDTVVEKLLGLDKEIHKEKEQTRKQNEEIKRRDEIKISVQKYRDDGYNIADIETLLDGDMGPLEDGYNDLIRRITKLKALKEKIFTLDAKGFEEDISNLSMKLNDPTKTEELEVELNRLKGIISDQRSKTDNIREKISEWEGRGFLIIKLKEMMNKDPIEGEKSYVELLPRIQELIDIQGRLQGIRHREVGDEVQKIMLKIKNPDHLEAVRSEYRNLERRVSELEKTKEKRKELNELLKVWKGQGFQMDYILDIMGKEKTIAGLEKTILESTMAIATLEAFHKEFDTEERGWFPEDEEFIKKNLWNPENAKKVLFRFEQLKVKYANEEKRRGQLRRELDNMSKAGIDISGVEKLLHGDTETLVQNYTKRFKPQTVALLKLKKEIVKEAKGKPELQEFAKTLTDPFKLEEYRETRKALAKVKKVVDKKEDRKKGESDNITSLKNMAKLSYKEGGEEKLREALNLFDAALSIDPDNKECQFFKKKVLLKMKMKPVQEHHEEKEPERPPDEVDGTEPAVEEKVEPPGGRKPDPNCTFCSGSGKCSWCNGEINCTSCNGTGKYFGEECPTCKGSGKCSTCEGTGRCNWCSL
ncbi:MAG: hypothetical protein KAH57_11140 [Thermoplasmata archaeon]|nr:hypothetical protein [Thermoplasmata archaeon]